MGETETNPVPPPPPGGEGGTEIGPGVYAAAGTLRFQFARSGGPGGQNVNKVNTKAELWVALSGIRGLAPDAMDRLVHFAGKRVTKEREIHIAAETARTQEGNRDAVMMRLRELIEKAQHRPKVRKLRKPSKAAKRRRLEGKKRLGEKKRLRRELE